MAPKVLFALLAKGRVQPERILAKRILLADDQQGVREAIRFLLLVDQHTVVEAANGREALEAFQHQPFDLVITDYAMPVMAGNELARKIKALAPHQPILMITAYAADMGDKENPVDALLNKPFSFDELRQAIARLLATGCVV